MPIATPEVYAEMLGRAKEHSFAFPAINCVGSETVNAALKGFADAGSDGIIQFSTGGAEFALRPRRQGHGDRRGRAGRVRPHRRRQVPDHRRAAHRPLSEGQAGQLRPAAAGHLAEAGRRGPEPAVPVAHVGRVGGADRREPGHRPRAAQGGRGRQDHPRDRDRRRRRRGGRRRPRDQRQALHHAPRTSRRPSRRSAHGEHGKYLLAATFGNVHGVYKPGNVKLRPDILDQGQKVAAAKLGLPEGAKPFDFVFHGGSGSLKSEIEDSLQVRRGEDERRHRHPVRIHPSARRAHVHQLRRCAQGRRRGRQQEGLRPAQLPEEGRGRHVRARRRGMQRPAQRGPASRHRAG